MVCGIAQQGMSQRGYEIWDSGTDGDFVVIGGHDDLIVQVVAVPQGDQNSWVVVTGFSEDSSTAGQGRDEIRTHIVTAGGF
jgi:hypothetical protein